MIFSLLTVPLRQLVSKRLSVCLTQFILLAAVNVALLFYTLLTVFCLLRSCHKRLLNTPHSWAHHAPKSTLEIEDVRP